MELWDEAGLMLLSTGLERWRWRRKCRKVEQLLHERMVRLPGETRQEAGPVLWQWDVDGLVFRRL